MDRLNRQSFQRVLGRTDVMALSIGTIIGWGWVALTGSWITTGGVMGSAIAFLIGAFIFVLIGNIYAELAASLPVAGGEIAFSYRAMGHNVAVFVGWTIVFAYIGVAAWEGIALSAALSYLFPAIVFPWKIVGVMGAIGIAALNYVGIRPTSIFQVVITSGMMLVGFLFFYSGMAFGDLKNMEPLFTDNVGIFSVLLIVPSMLIGFDIIPQFAEEMNIVPKQIGRLLILSIVMCSVWYILIILGASFAAPLEVRSSGVVPVADAMAYCMKSPFFGQVIILGGILGIFTSWNGFMVASTRLLFAMGRAKMIAPVFGRLHGKHGSPTYAIWLVGSVCAIAPLFGQKALLWLVNISAFEAVISYLFVSISFLVLRYREPSLERPYRFSKGAVLSYLVIICLLVLLILYSPLGLNLLKWPHEWLILLLWYALGGLMVIYARIKYPHITNGERETLIFGESDRRNV